MRYFIFSFRFLLCLCAGLLLFSGCKNSNNPDTQGEEHPITAPDRISLVIDSITVSASRTTYGKEVRITTTIKEGNPMPDSIQFLVDGIRYSVAQKAMLGYIWQTRQTGVGLHHLSVASWFGSSQETDGYDITVLSDVKPAAQRIQVVHTYPHNPESFTQGLEYVDNILYEGTGLNGHSAIQKLNLETGKIIQSRPLDREYFGEGITVFGDKLIEITWQSRKGFVYDKNTFNPVGEFGYLTEGWGITHDAKSLIMSDGTENLYFLDPVTFNQTKRLQVYDNIGPVAKLNELEYINGEIYANVWQTDDIIRIDALTGKVLARISLAGLLSEADTKAETDVLNGIAWDSAGKRLFVTGKLWPKLFEIKLIGGNL